MEDDDRMKIYSIIEITNDGKKIKNKNYIFRKKVVAKNKMISLITNNEGLLPEVKGYFKHIGTGDLEPHEHLLKEDSNGRSIELIYKELDATDISFCLTVEGTGLESTCMDIIVDSTELNYKKEIVKTREVESNELS